MFRESRENEVIYPQLSKNHDDRDHELQRLLDSDVTSQVFFAQQKCFYEETIEDQQQSEQQALGDDRSKSTASSFERSIHVVLRFSVDFVTTV